MASEIENLFSQTIKTNVIGTLNMLGLAKRVGARLEYLILQQYLTMLEIACL